MKQGTNQKKRIWFDKYDLQHLKMCNRFFALISNVARNDDQQLSDTEKTIVSGLQYEDLVAPLVSVELERGFLSHRRLATRYLVSSYFIRKIKKTRKLKQYNMTYEDLADLERTISANNHQKNL